MTPKLRFPEFNSDWSVEKMGNLFSHIRNGFVGTATPYYVTEGIKYLQGKNIKGGQILEDAIVYISYEFHLKQKKSVLKENDLLMVQSGHVGECAVVTQRHQNSNCHALLVATPHKNVFSDFYKYFFYSPRGKQAIHKITTGNTIKHILSSDLKNVIVPITSDLNEQLQIIRLLKLIDQKIDLLTKKKEALETYKKGLMQKIFTQELRFKRDDGTDYPEWKTSALEAFCEIIRGITYNSGNVISDGGTLVLRSTNIQSNKLVFSEGTKQFIDVIPKSKLVLKDRDLIVCMSNGSKRLVGKSAVFHQDDYNGIITAGGFCAIFRSKNTLTPYLLQSAMWKRYLHILLAGSSINNLRNNEVGQLRFQLPSNEEALRISELFGAVDTRIKLVVSQIEEVSKMKKGLLQQMFV
jgi:type I restriction enzyme S subunit